MLASLPSLFMLGYLPSLFVAKDERWALAAKSSPHMGVPKIRGPIFGSPYNKSPTILGYILGPLIFGVSHMNLQKVSTT